MTTVTLRTSVLQWTTERWQLTLPDTIDTSTWTRDEWIDAFHAYDAIPGADLVLLDETPGQVEGDREFDGVDHDGGGSVGAFRDPTNRRTLSS